MPTYHANHWIGHAITCNLPLMLSNFGLSGGGLSGGGFGRAPAVDTAPLNQYLGAPLGATAQQVGVAQYGTVWASSNCPSCNTNILEMQQLINQVGAQLGAGVSVAVDGKVGEGTAAALRKVSALAASRGQPALATYVTAEQIAKNADFIRNVLAQLKSTLPATAPTTIPSVQPSGGGSQVPVATTASAATVWQPPTAKPGIFSQKNLPFIVGGVILAVGIGAAVLILRTPAPE